MLGLRLRIDAFLNGVPWRKDVLMVPSRVCNLQELVYHLEDRYNQQTLYPRVESEHSDDIIECCSLSLEGFNFSLLDGIDILRDKDMIRVDFQGSKYVASELHRKSKGTSYASNQRRKSAQPGDLVTESRLPPGIDGSMVTSLGLRKARHLDARYLLGQSRCNNEGHRTIKQAFPRTKRCRSAINQPTYCIKSPAYSSGQDRVLSNGNVKRSLKDFRGLPLVLSAQSKEYALSSSSSLSSELTSDSDSSSTSSSSSTSTTSSEAVRRSTLDNVGSRRSNSSSSSTTSCSNNSDDVRNETKTAGEARPVLPQLSASVESNEGKVPSSTTVIASKKPSEHAQKLQKRRRGAARRKAGIESELSTERCETQLARSNVITNPLLDAVEDTTNFCSIEGGRTILRPGSRMSFQILELDARSSPSLSEVFTGQVTKLDSDVPSTSAENPEVSSSPYCSIRDCDNPSKVHSVEVSSLRNVVLLDEDWNPVGSGLERVSGDLNSSCSQQPVPDQGKDEGCVVYNPNIGHVTIPKSVEQGKVDEYVLLQQIRVRGAIRRQIDYYFSDSNYPNDKFLKSQEDADGYVPLAVIMNFNRIRPLSQNIEFIASCLADLSNAELGESRTTIRKRRPKA